MRLSCALAVAGLLLPTLSNCSSLTPPVLPLIVRNPYLSTWLGNARDVPWSKWPMFWTGQEIGLSVLASVPESSQVYPLLGRPHDSLLPVRPGDGYNVSFPIYHGANYDASTTNLTYSIPSSNGRSKPAKLTLSFLSPITPSSTLRQSLPAAYVTVFVEGSFDINIYIDVNGQWVSGDRGSQLTWQLSQSVFDDGRPGLKTWAFKRKTELLFTEYLDRAEWGTLHFSAPADVRHDSGTSALLRQRFSRTGTLQNEIDDNFRSIMDEEPVFAFAKSFIFNKTSSSSSSSRHNVTFTIAHTQDPAIQFAAARGLTLMRPLWASYFSTQELLAFHYLDLGTASALAWNYSAQLAIDAYQSGATDYVDIVGLSARQVMGAVSFVGIPEDPIIFMKEISSDGNTQTIDVIFPAFPFFLYSNPQWLAYLLEPLIEHMLSGQYPNKYAMHDIGAHFPNATGHPDGRDEYMPVEECGNILIMGLALANAFKYHTKNAGEIFSSLGKQDADVPSSPAAKVFTLQFKDDAAMKYLDAQQSEDRAHKKAKKWVDRSYRLWKQWTGYLIEFSLRPANQLSTDDFAGWLALQTNLALKGIIGINAMSKLAEIVGNDADAKLYRNISKTYVAKWEEYGLSRDKTHAKVAYDWYGSWTTLYNLYADSLLCFRVEPEQSRGAKSVPSTSGHQKPMKPPPEEDETAFVPGHIYKLQSDWYYNVRQKYGLPLDSRHLYTKTDWEFFAMAISARAVRQPILESVAKWVNETVTDRPLTDLHVTEGRGAFPGPNFFARPVVGGHFAFLALERACGGKAVDGLKFLDDKRFSIPRLEVSELLQLDALDGLQSEAREDL